MPPEMSACGRECSLCREFGGSCSGCPGCGIVLKNRCDCSTCIYICPRRPGARVFLQQGLAGGELRWPADKRPVTPADPGKLPIHFPAVADPFKKTPGAGGLPWVVVHGARFFSSTGTGLRPSAVAVGGSIRRWLNVDPETKVGTHFYVRDRFLEGFWRHREDIYPLLCQFDLVFCPNFSVYEDSPRYEHLVNIRRSVIVYEEMLEHGIRVVPDIAWYQKIDLDNWAGYVRDSQINLVATSAQTVGTGLHTLGSWKGYLAGIRYLAEQLPGGVGIIIVGVSSPKKVTFALREMDCSGRQINFMNSQAFMMARKRRLIEQNGKIVMMNQGIDFDSLFLLNTSALTKCYGDIKEAVRKDAKR